MTAAQTPVSSIDKFVDAARYLVGTADVLVCNTDVSRRFTDVSTPGVQHLAAQLIPAMIDKGGGDLLFVSSGVAGQRPRAGWGSTSRPGTRYSRGLRCCGPN